MIKNYTSNSKQTFDIIQKCLIQHKAQQIMFEYEDNGTVKALAFVLKINDKIFGFRLPARLENVEKMFFIEKNKKRQTWQHKIELNDEEKQQAYRTAWANIRDWITAQMALIDTEQVKMEEVFLPYMVVGNNKTLFEHQQEIVFKALPTGQVGGGINQ